MHKCFKVPTFWREQSKTVPEWNRSAVDQQTTVAISHALTTMPLVTLIHFRRTHGQLSFSINKVTLYSLKTEHHPNLKSVNQEEPLSYLLELLYQALGKIVQNQFLKNPNRWDAFLIFILTDFCHFPASSAGPPSWVLTLLWRSVPLLPPQWSQTVWREERAPHTFQKTDTCVMLGPPLSPSSSLPLPFFSCSE